MSWKNLSLRAKLVLGFGFSVIILLIIAGMALYDTSRLTELTAARATARQFLWNLEQLVSLTRSAENDARGFMLTGDQHFIATFDDDTKKVPALFADLEKGDPAQREALHGLRPIVDAKIASLQMLIERRRQEGLKPLLLDAAALAGDEHITALRSCSTSAPTTPRALRRERSSPSSAARSRPRWRCCSSAISSAPASRVACAISCAARRASAKAISPSASPTTRATTSAASASRSTRWRRRCSRRTAPSARAAQRSRNECASSPKGARRCSTARANRRSSARMPPRPRRNCATASTPSSSWPRKSAR